MATGASVWRLISIWMNISAAIITADLPGPRINLSCLPKCHLLPRVRRFTVETPGEEAKNLRRWLKQHQPDAILTTQPYLPQLLRDLGYRIPEDIAVAGTSVCDIPVDAGIDQRSIEIGRIAMQMLIKQINVGEQGTPSNPCRILVESHWQDGQSLPPRN
jgi:DNA-binding LacI/PurR family transcriptional regulator